MDLSALSALPAYQGTGWQARRGSHEEDVAAARGWRRVGVAAEWVTLRSVLLVVPGRGWTPVADWAAAQFRGPVDPGRLRRQLLALAGVYRRNGVEVLVAERDEEQVNAVFARDSFLVTPAGAVVGRMGSAVRAGEERTITADLAVHGVPVVATIRGDAVLEGADVLWVAPDHVVVGIGNRTDSAGAAQLTSLLDGLGVRTSVVDMPSGVQHLLGLTQMLADDLVVLRRSLAPDSLVDVLTESGLDITWVEDDDEIVERQGLNVVPLGPRRVVMPAGCPRTADTLTRAGVTVAETVVVDEIAAAAGGIACATGVLGRW